MSNEQSGPDKDQLASLVRQWQAGTVAEREVHWQAQRLWSSVSEWPEYGEDDLRSIAIEVLRLLESLDFEWVTEKDAPAMLEFLAAAAGSESAAWTRWRQYWEGVDFSQRREDLKANPYYSASGPFV